MKKAFTLVELLVVITVGGLVTGLIFDVLMETNRATSELATHQLMRQEAALIAQSVDRVLRFRQDVDLPTGGAAPETAAGGTSATLPMSIREITTPTTSQTTVVLSITTAPLQRSADQRQIPPSMKSLMSTASASVEKYTKDELICRSPASDSTATLEMVALRNFKDRVVAQRGALGSLPPLDAPVRYLGAHSDKFNSSVSFTFADEFQGLTPKLTSFASAPPALVKYEIKVWPANPRNNAFSEARSSSGRPLNFVFHGGFALR